MRKSVFVYIGAQMQTEGASLPWELEGGKKMPSIFHFSRFQFRDPPPPMTPSPLCYWQHLSCCDKRFVSESLALHHFKDICLKKEVLVFPGGPLIRKSPGSTLATVYSMQVYAADSFSPKPWWSAESELVYVKKEFKKTTTTAYSYYQKIFFFTFVILTETW